MPFPKSKFGVSGLFSKGLGTKGIPGLAGKTVPTKPKKNKTAMNPKMGKGIMNYGAKGSAGKF
jgi:hypothetical protein